MEYLKGLVKENVKVVEGVYSLVIEHKAKINAGQFYMIKTKNTFLGRPISVCETYKDCIRFVYATIGAGTNEMKNIIPGDKVEIIGPLGNGFDTKKDYGKVALVSGGIGIAPLIELSKKLRENNEYIKMDFYGGFRDDIYLLDDISKYVDEVKIATNTGKYGHKGFVTDIIPLKEYDTVLCCGPEIMMEKVVKMCKEAEVNIYVSMEKHMACGVGACLVCTCKTKSGNKRTCKDGPVFNGLEVEF